MTEQQRPDDDVEGHSRAKFDPEGAEEDVEGHKKMLEEEGSAGDTAGDARRSADDVVPGDDVEGHHVMWKLDEQGDDDVEGHGQRGL